jgi:nucleoside-diphosphate-sugar epimerase
MGTLKYTPKMKTSTLINVLIPIVVYSVLSWGHVNPIGIRACYDEGKRVAESLTYSYQRQNGVEVRVARIFNTFGKFTQVRTFDL